MKAFVMIGAPGSGKSTAARKLAKEHNAVIVCGDKIRRELYGDAANQGNWAEVHNEIVEQLEENVGKTIVLDGTHYCSSYRVGAQITLMTYGWEHIIAYVVNPSLERCIIQNSLRSRNVPRYIIQSMWEKLQASLPNLEHEGFSEVVYADTVYNNQETQ
jgi:predicted kinase